MGIRLEIDMPEHHYNNIMALDSVSLGRVPYKGIIMYAINAIKHGKVLDQEPTTKNKKQYSILDKIRAEIEQLPITDTAVRLVIKILDKYKGEQEHE